ncbi:hypothetical protein pb186bvf_018842 [Paramecium bursaria]
MIADPLKQLPKSKFDIDAWKTQFLASNNQKEEFIWFWDNFDKNGWSIWEFQYKKTENEGKLLITTKNMVKGFLQRINQHFRQYCFAIFGVYGDEPDLNIRGAWIWRGREIPQYLKDNPFDNFIFNKLDPKIKADRATFEDYWIKQNVDVDEICKQFYMKSFTFFT